MKKDLITIVDSWNTVDKQRAKFINSLTERQIYDLVDFIRAGRRVMGHELESREETIER